MAERETVAIFAASRGSVVFVFARPEACLDVARDLARVMGEVGTISVIGDRPQDGAWTWRTGHQVGDGHKGEGPGR